jgi:predicted DsbA family dithiol-disulfide isomerase
MSERTRVVEVFADVWCPFTHVGLLMFVEHRERVARPDVKLRVRAWPLEIINGKPLSADFVAEEIDEIRAQVTPQYFVGFSPDAFPATTLPALVLSHRAYERDLDAGEQVSLELRDLLFEQGVDVSRPEVLDDVASRHRLDAPGERVDTGPVLTDRATGIERGVTGSPHFFTPAGDFFCPSLDIQRDAQGHLRITSDPEGFRRFLDACFAE